MGSTTNKAWAGALMSMLSSLTAAAAQIDFNTNLTANSIRDLIITGIVGALVGFGGVYVAPRNIQPLPQPLPPAPPPPYNPNRGF